MNILLGIWWTGSGNKNLLIQKNAHYELELGINGTDPAMEEWKMHSIYFCFSFCYSLLPSPFSHCIECIHYTSTGLEFPYWDLYEKYVITLFPNRLKNSK